LRRSLKLKKGSGIGMVMKNSGMLLHSETDTFLFAKGGLVRGESSIRAELSDMFSILKKMKDHQVMMPIFLLCKFWKEKEMQARLYGGLVCAINM
jgi:hypothetical protein